MCYYSAKNIRPSKKINIRKSTMQMSIKIEKIIYSKYNYLSMSWCKRKYILIGSVRYHVCIFYVKYIIIIINFLFFD